MVELLLFAIGSVFGIFLFSQVLLPLIYGVPRATYWALRKRALWRTPLTYLIAPLLWSTLFVVFAFVLIRFAPDVAERLYDSPGMYYGQWIGVGLGAARAFLSSSGRNAVRADFAAFVAPQATPSGLERLKLGE